jgi:kynurenine formamidase
MERQMGNDQHSLAWRPPTYDVDANGKIVGLANQRHPNNWGRWGPDDQRGTANLITADQVVRAARLVQTGEVVSCALPLGGRVPVHPSRTPVLHMFRYSGSDMVTGSAMSRATRGYQGSDDYLMMPIQGTTQWDGLAHVGYDDAMYNGFWMGTVEAQLGAKRCGIHLLSDSLVGRGVLLDLPRFHAVERLEPGHAIVPEELDACAKAQEVAVRAGDLVLIRTGHIPWFYDLADTSEFFRAGAPGLSLTCAEWAHERDVSAIAMDNMAIEVEPFEGDGEIYPLHVRLVRDLGVTLGEMWWFEDLANACQRVGRNEFLLSAPPLRIRNGAGSMLNPVAIF